MLKRLNMLVKYDTIQMFVQREDYNVSYNKTICLNKRERRSFYEEVRRI